MEQGILEVRFTAQRLRNVSSAEDTKTRVHVGSPKSIRSIRDIPKPDWLRELISPFELTSKEAFFLSGRTDRPVEPRVLQYKLQRYLKACNIAGATFHTLRHTFATRCVEQSFELKSLSEILGHGSVNITLNRYVHSSMELKKKI